MVAESTRGYPREGGRSLGHSARGTIRQSTIHWSSLTMADERYGFCKMFLRESDLHVVRELLTSLLGGQFETPSPIPEPGTTMHYGRNSLPGPSSAWHT